MLLYRTKQRSASKGVAYGISALIWIMAIMVLIVAALIGISREIKVRSSPVSYRLTSIEAMRTSQQIYEFLDAERRNTIEQVLIYVGALGGYSPKALVLDEKEVKHLPEDFKYFPQPVVVYWINESSGYTEIPGENEVKQNLIEFVSTGFTNPSSLLTTALTASLGYKPAISYVLDLRKLDESGIDVYWIPIGEQRFTIYLPSALSPVVKYSFDLLVHNHFNTSFFNVYEEARNFAQGNWLVTRYFNDTNKTPVPTILDSEFLIIESNQSAPEPFDFTEQVEKNRPTPIERLVEYADTLPNYPNDCSKYNKNDFGSLVRNCQSDDCFKTVDCTLHAKRNSSGVLTIDGFSGTNCTGAVKYAMCKILNRINDELKLNMSKKTYISGELFDSKYDYRIQIFELNLSLNSMWMEYDDYNKSGTCEDAREANLQGQKYVYRPFKEGEDFFELVGAYFNDDYFDEWTGCYGLCTCREFAVVPVVTMNTTDNVLMVFNVTFQGSQGWFNTAEKHVGWLIVKGNRTVYSPIIVIKCCKSAISNPSGWVRIRYNNGTLAGEIQFNCDWPVDYYDENSPLEACVGDNECPPEVGGEEYVCPSKNYVDERCPVLGLYNCSGQGNVISWGGEAECTQETCDTTCQAQDQDYTNNKCYENTCICGVFGSQKCGDVNGTNNGTTCVPFYLRVSNSKPQTGETIKITVHSNASFNNTKVKIKSDPSGILDTSCRIGSSGECSFTLYVNWSEWNTNSVTIFAEMDKNNLYYGGDKVDATEFDAMTNFYDYNEGKVVISKS